MMPRETGTPGNNQRDNQSAPKPDKSTSPEVTKAAHDQAERDIAEDPDLSIHSPNDDLDEGETARLGENKTDMV